MMIFKRKKKNIENRNAKEDNNSKEIKSKKFKVLYIFRVLFVITIIILLYIIINFVKLFNKNEVKIYEVTTGEIVNVDRHKGFIYREENVATCANDGYINFYVANAERVKSGSFIYTVNDVPSVINTYELNDSDKKNIKQNIKMYSNNISNLDFANIYVAKDSLKELVNEINTIKQLED